MPVYPPAIIDTSDFVKNHPQQRPSYLQALEGLKQMYPQKTNPYRLTESQSITNKVQGDQ